MPWDAAVRMPLIRVWALWCVDSEAQGMKPAGPRYGEQDWVNALNDAVARGILDPQKLVRKMLPGWTPEVRDRRSEIGIAKSRGQMSPSAFSL